MQLGVVAGGLLIARGMRRINKDLICTPAMEEGPGANMAPSGGRNVEGGPGNPASPVNSIIVGMILGQMYIMQCTV